MPAFASSVGLDAYAQAQARILLVSASSRSLLWLLEIQQDFFCCNGPLLSFLKCYINIFFFAMLLDIIKGRSVFYEFREVLFFQNLIMQVKCCVFGG